MDLVTLATNEIPAYAGMTCFYMRILWQNLGYSYFEWVWLNWLKRFNLNRRDHIFYMPNNGTTITNWIRESKAQIFTGCEVVTDDDAKTLSWSPQVNLDRVVSTYHEHGRILATELPYKHCSIKIDNEHITWYEFEEFNIFPIHLHWCDSDIRLLQVHNYCNLLETLDKPVIMLGDFNIWTLGRRWQLFRSDRSAYRLLERHLIESSSRVMTTNMIPGIKLDYVWVSPELVNRVSVTKPKKPIWRMDHDPLLVEVH